MQVFVSILASVQRATNLCMLHNQRLVGSQNALLQSKGGAFVGDSKDFLRFTVGDHSVSQAHWLVGGVATHVLLKTTSCLQLLHCDCFAPHQHRQMSLLSLFYPQQSWLLCQTTLHQLEHDFLHSYKASSQLDGPICITDAIVQVIPAFEEAMVGMRVGGVRRLIVPQELGYPGQPPDFTKQGPTPGNFSVSQTVLFFDISGLIFFSLMALPLTLQLVCARHLHDM